jgi:hypothetical protein
MVVLSAMLEFVLHLLNILSAVFHASTTITAMEQQMVACSACLDIATTRIITCVGIHVLAIVNAHSLRMIARIVIMDFARPRPLRIDVVSRAVALPVATEQ